MMPSASVYWKTLEDLRNSSKGKITYNRGSENIMSGDKETISLSSQAGLILDCMGSSPLKTSRFLDSRSGHSSPSLSEQTPASIVSRESVSDINAQALQVKHEKTLSDDSEVSSPVPPPTLFTETCRILKIQREYRLKAQVARRQRQEMQEKFTAELVSSGLEQLKCFEDFMVLKRRQEPQSTREKIRREPKGSIGQEEKLREEQKHRTRILNLRQREQKREHEAEMERQAEGRERLRNLNTIQEEILQLNQQLESSSQTKSDLPRASLSSYSTCGNQLYSQVTEVLRKTAEGAFPSAEDITEARRGLHALQVEVAKVQEHKKWEEEALRKQAEKKAGKKAGKKAEKKAAQLAKEKPQRKGLQNTAEDSTLKWYKDLQDSAAQCAQSFEQLNSPKDIQTKKLKLELQKAVTIPINQISRNSVSQLREVFDKIDRLLSARSVVWGGKSVSISQHPQGLEFVSYKVAERFVKQGEEEVGCHHEAAFPIALVASGIWERHPQVGDLILAHLHKKCPYAVPHYPPMKDGTSVEEYQKILGYRVEDSRIEGQDSFLKRMSGMIRLYAAMIQLRWPYGSKQGVKTFVESAPHGLNHGLRWLAQMLDMEPLAEITATLLLDFLEVCGNALMKRYHSQFWKLILVLKEEYFPMIEAVTGRGQMGSVFRLKEFLETSLQRGEIKPPKGQMSSKFWRF